jgi:hypothetical protein
LLDGLGRGSTDEVVGVDPAGRRGRGSEQCRVRGDVHGHAVDAVELLGHLAVVGLQHEGALGGMLLLQLAALAVEPLNDGNRREERDQAQRDQQPKHQLGVDGL